MRWLRKTCGTGKTSIGMGGRWDCAQALKIAILNYYKLKHSDEFLRFTKETQT